MTVDLFVEDDVARIVLNQPERLNAVSPPVVESLCNALESAINKGVLAAIISGEGRAFCAGHDLKYESDSNEYTSVRADIERLQDVTRLIRRAPFPVIAAVHGYALGAGCELALCSDYVVAADDAVFGFPEVAVGLSITGGISHILPLTVGPMKAKALVLLGQQFSAHEAYEMGLISRVVAADVLQQEVLAVAKSLTTLPHKALALAKMVLDRGAESDLADAMELETLHALATRGSDEASVAASSFRHKDDV